MSKAWSTGSTRRWRNLRAQVFETKGDRCVIALQGTCTVQATTAHHVMPKSRGGLDELANLVPACEPCNLKVGDGPPPPQGRRAVRF